MKKDYDISVKIPEGVVCKFSGNMLQCSKGNTTLSRHLESPNLGIAVNENEIIISCKKANRKERANVNAYASHVKNMLHGLKERFVYEMEICNVHFPMTVKVENDKIVISNFLGEKSPRVASILPGVEVNVEGNKIRISSADVEKAGQTAANIEKAATVTKKDRRIFQDGIFITKKPGANL